MNRWKVLGLAGLAGVAAAGVIIAREQRQRTQLAPEEIRARLHERLEQAPTAPTWGTVPDVPISPATPRRWLPRLRRRRAAPIRWPDRA
ncbi:MAG TPA: hypothetical protein VIM01_13200 [Dermatophilaceae bacterium]